jgi:hypothetical protein
VTVVAELEGYGVDRLSLAFPLRDWDRDPEVWTGGINSRPGLQGTCSYNGSVPIGGGGPLTIGGVQVFVGAREITATGRPWGKVEFNPARVVDPDGVGLCPVSDLRSTIEAAVYVAREIVTPAVPIDDMRVRRVDLARDFAGVDSAAFYVRGLLNVRRPWARYSAVYNDPKLGGAESLRVGSGAGMVRLYDKHEESPERAAPGHLRWEAECRRGWAENYGGVAVVTDLNAYKLGTLASNRWEWSSMGTQIAATDRVIEKIQRAGHRADCPKGCKEHLSAAEQRGFYGYLVFTAKGWPSPTAKATGAKYGRIARDLAITCAILEPDVDEADITGRLDWDTGREVLRVA